MRLLLLVTLVLPLGGMRAGAQQQGSKVDLGLTFAAQRSLKAGTGENFWSTGGSIEVGVNAYRGWGAAANVTGTHSGSISSSGIPLSLVTVTFGPRYRWHAAHKLSLYGEGLAGEADGFRSLFPAGGGAQSSGNSLALQVGGGVDYRLNARFAVRLLDAGWIRTQLPNATNNVQNNLRLGAGLVLRFGR